MSAALAQVRSRYTLARPQQPLINNPKGEIPVGGFCPMRNPKIGGNRVLCVCVCVCHTLWVVNGAGDGMRVRFAWTLSFLVLPSLVSSRRSWCN
jgi:hypothetical protein